MIKGNDIQERLIDFAVDIVALTTRLPKNNAGNHIANQLLRSGTSAAPNYAEARGAESTRDFVHKLKIALKELNESNVWLEILKRSKMVDEIHLKKTFDECLELRKILASSFRTAEKKENR